MVREYGCGINFWQCVKVFWPSLILVFINMFSIRRNVPSMNKAGKDAIQFCTQNNFICLM